MMECYKVCYLIFSGNSLKKADNEEAYRHSSPGIQALQFILSVLHRFFADSRMNFL